MQFMVRGTIQTGIDALDYAISDLEILHEGTTVTVFSSSGAGGGLASFSLGDGATASLIDTALYNPSWALGIGPDLALVDDGLGGVLAVFGLTGPTRLGAFSVAANGEIGAVTSLEGLDPGQPRPEALGTTSDGNLLIAGGGPGFSLFDFDGTDLINIAVVTGESGEHIDGVSQFTEVDVGGSQILISGSETEFAITTFQMTVDGLLQSDVSGPDQGVGLMVPTDLATAEVASAKYVVVASAMGENGALSVFHVDNAGSLTATDHVLDTLHTRFGAVQSVEVIEYAGVSFVVAGGGDDGLSLFALLPGGKLQLLDTIVDTHSTGLANVSAIAGAAIGETLRLLVGSQSEGRLTDLAVDLSALGIQAQAGNDGGVLTGTDKNDFLVGMGGADSLDAGAGNDILIDGRGSDSLTGGAGSDTFVMRDDAETDTITDFNVSLDWLDLASWPMFHDPASLTIASASYGAVITWRDEILHVQKAGGGPINPETLRGRVISGINRPMDLSEIEIPEGPVFDIAGTNGDDIIHGGSGDETIFAGLGNDTIYAGDGDDIVLAECGLNCVYLDAGNDIYANVSTNPDDDGDTVYGGAGNDEITTGAGNDRIFGGVGDDVIRSGLGDDVVDGGQGADIAWLGGGDDTYEAADAENGGDDEVHGEDGDDTLRGGDGNDLLFGDAGNDVLHGGNGDDTLSGGTGADSLYGGNGNDVLDGGADNDILDGSFGDDTLYGGDGADSLSGGVGRDFLHGGGGNDMLDGGAWNDVLFGDAGDDHLIGDLGHDELHGGEGDDTLEGGIGTDWLYGGVGNDVLSGGHDDDRLEGGAGLDLLAGGHGNDTLLGGDDADELRGDAGDDRLFGDSGHDLLLGGSGNDELHGGTGRDELLGGEGNDALHGGEDADELNGEGGNDLLFGGEGDDLLTGGAGHDEMHGEGGADTLKGGRGNDRLFGGTEADLLLGQGGRDRLSGDENDDRLSGGRGNDRLWGGDGNDVLIGGAGNDRLWGGEGEDVFEFRRTTGKDKILDFDPDLDTLRLIRIAPGKVDLIDNKAGLLVDWGSGSVLLLGLDAEDFSQSDILFG